MNTERLEAKGFQEVRPNVFVRLKVNGERVTGVALWKQDSATLFAGARMDMKEARKLVLRLCRTASQAFPRPRRLRARKLLSAVLAKNLEVAGSDDPEVVFVDHLIGLFDAETEVGRRRLIKGAFKKARKGINKLAKKVAKNKVMQKLRNGYAKVMDGPVGDVAAKAVGKALQAVTGIPAPVTELAVRAHLHSKASRLRDGGFAGAVERTSRGRGSVRREAKREGRRFGRAAKRTGRGAARKYKRMARGAMARRSAAGGGAGMGMGMGVGDSDSLDLGYIASLARRGKLSQIVAEVGAVQRAHGRVTYSMGLG